MLDYQREFYFFFLKILSQAISRKGFSTQRIPLQLEFSQMICNCGRYKNPLKQKCSVPWKIISDLQSIPTGFNSAVLSKSSARFRTWNWSNWDSRAGQLCPQPAERSIQSTVSPLCCSSKRRSTRPLAMSKHGTSAGPAKSCSFDPLLKLDLFKKNKK